MTDKVHQSHRSCEVEHIQTPQQIARCRGIDKVDDDILALKANVDTGIGRRQIDDDPALAIGTASEIDIADAEFLLARCGCALRKFCRLRRILDYAWQATIDREDKRVAFQCSRIGQAARQIDNHAGATRSFYHADRANIAFADFHGVFAEAIDNIGQVERDAGGIGNGEARWDYGQWISEIDANDDLAALQRRSVDRFKQV